MAAFDTTIETILRTQARIKTSKKRKISYLYFWFVQIHLLRNNNLAAPSAFFRYNRRPKKRNYIFKTALGTSL